MWGGYGSGVHYDLMEVYHLPTGAWDQKATTGTPPPGTWGYSSKAIGKDIYYFGGFDGRYQNSLHCFNVDSFKWRKLSPSSSDHGPMKRRYSGMVSAHFDGEDYLVIIGGIGSSSINIPKQPDAQYINSYGDLRFTNNTAVMFGGETDIGRSNKLYMISFTKISVDILEVPNPGGSVQWPKGRWGHSSVLITTSSGPHLLVVGGYPAYDVWLLDINKRKWKELASIKL
ncbi:PREDICTED: host cell factor 2-like [Amphimedon queenslandica]|uniref:Uncharacterized protein n=1 Tax=Amphimedon queenslandica TaxID=400682 RepID=A0AAN0JG37_AMPQE|nr:PREDICTED: host cell factor 2-like [Amphimedon queenslandica]|eukprot:XP_019855752.1 PREDICTED: host cell factor 2-like [Amphimedon queenslandica]